MESAALKGQTSIEFILLIVIILLFVQALILPTVDLASNTAIEVSRIGQTKLAAERLSNAIQLIGVSANESRQTIHIFLPEKSSIACNGEKIVYNSELESSRDIPTDCTDTPTPHCEKEIDTGIDFSCDTGFSPDSSSNPALNLEDFYSLRIEKGSSGVVVSVVE